MTIAEASKKFEISADTLRYYERIGIIPPVPRTDGGIRDYDEASCQWIELAKCMRSAGIQIEALIEYCELYQQGDGTIRARRDLLVEEQKRLLIKMDEIKRALERLDFKISRYNTAVETGILNWDLED